MRKDRFQRGQIYYCDLSPAFKSEQGGVRPVLIIQNNLGNKISPTVIVCAITSQTDKRRLPTHIEIGKNDVNGLKKDSIVMTEQVRTVDKGRMRDYIGKLSDIDMFRIEAAFKVSFGMLG